LPPLRVREGLSRTAHRQWVFYSRDRAASRVYLSTMHKLAYLVCWPLRNHRYEGVPRNADDLSLRPVRWSVSVAASLEVSLSGARFGSRPGEIVRLAYLLSDTEARRPILCAWSSSAC